MTVHDESSVAPLRLKEFMTNPNQVIGILVVDRGVRTNAGMDEQKIATDELVTQALHEQFVCTRKDAEKAAVQVVDGFGSVKQLDAIGCKRLHASQLLPVLQDSRVLNEAFQYGLMIAAQANRAIRDEPDRQQVDHAPGMRPAIDVVAKINFDLMRDRSPSDVIVDALDYLAQQIGPAVDIANGVDSRIGWR